jgi:hypothetical protein
MRDRGCHPASHRELFGLDQNLFDPFAIGDVTDNFGGTYHVARPIFNRGDHHRNVQGFAVLSDSRRLVMVNPLSRSQLSQDLLFFVLQLLWNKAED